MTIEVAVIPAAGRGTRLRPATRVVPKALVPIVDRPAIQYGVEEAARAGATEAIIVVDPGVGSLVHKHFADEGPLPGLEHMKITPVTQPVPLGLGHAVLTAREAVAGRTFFCMLADNISRIDVLDQMAAQFDGTSMVSLRHLTDDFLARYGVIVPGAWRSETVVEVRGAVEKPGVERAPSRLGLVGRYIFTPEVFETLDGLAPGFGGEIQLTDAIDALGRRGRCDGFVSPDDLLDVGNPAGLLEASTVLGLAHAELGEGYRRFLKGLL
ncbi:UTP--glucose-1-phosphate uridylyltransferase [bacterium BMS3Abin02]|nr:UTP--glucose-1-phosphate uridylyltransferase [bacterium BMS3Abin02]GBE23145.1 UTP--glucose-1-phosphate uridylyltransferase [bacterium BMS3Bbin01]